jgi:hypothetical protein
MLISERVTRGLSLWLMAAVAATTVGWTAAGRAGSLCSPQDHSCTPQASLTCCRPSSPDPADTVRLSVAAPPPGAPCHSSLTASVEALPRATGGVSSSRHTCQPLDLGILHRTFLI